VKLPTFLSSIRVENEEEDERGNECGSETNSPTFHVSVVIPDAAEATQTQQAETETHAKAQTGVVLVGDIISDHDHLLRGGDLLVVDHSKGWWVPL